MDLSDCSRLLYHWAISPQCDMKRKAGSYVKPVLVQSPLVVKMLKTPTLYNDNEIHLTNIIQTDIQRRWYNGQHSCLPSSWSGFDSRPTQCFKFYFLKSWREKVLSMPWPGFEPGLLRPQRRVLTTRRSRLRTVVLVLRTFGLAYYQKC